MLCVCGCNGAGVGGDDSDSDDDAVELWQNEELPMDTEEITDVLQEGDIDQLGSRPSGLNMAADMLLGGPAKVNSDPTAAVLASVIQGSLVLVPILVPMMMVSRLRFEDNPWADHYVPPPFIQSPEKFFYLFFAELCIDWVLPYMMP